MSIFPRKIPGSFLLILTTIFMLISFITCQPSYSFHDCSGNPANDNTATPDYISNLNSLLDSLSSNASLYSFYNDTSNGIYGLFLCRGDVSTKTCQICIKNASQEIRDRCPFNKTAIIWYDVCMLRYSDINFFGNSQTNPGLLLLNSMNTTSPDGPNYGALGLIYTLIASAADTNTKFGTKDGVVSKGSQHGYALVQCSRDISDTHCHSCLGQLSSEVEKCCQSRRGWTIFGPSCILRYEEYKFYEEPSVPIALQPTPNDKSRARGERGKSSIEIVIITVPLLTVVVAALLGFWYHVSYKKGRQREVMTKSEEIILATFNGSQKYKGSKHIQFMDGDIHTATYEHDDGEMHWFSLNDIQAATNNFSDANKLGEGGFGQVYKGRMVNGKEIAVKRLAMVSRQGLEEFKNEVILIIKLQHKNLVRLLGYCLEEDEKLLVYEYMANTSLDAFLFDPIKCKELDWAKRANIISGTARGLLYLHEDSRLKIIHRDMKASNVLLDDEMNPKISDFGTARIFGGNQMEANTARVVGTFGYMAPEYALEGLFSIKSDVYSFGILMLEILSGKRNRGIYHSEFGQNLLSYAWRLWSEGKGLELIDTKIVDKCSTSESLRWIQIALLCAQDDPADRPTMSMVVLMLVSKAVNLPNPSTPYTVGRLFPVPDLSSLPGMGIVSPTSDNISKTITI